MNVGISPWPWSSSISGISSSPSGQSSVPSFTCVIEIVLPSMQSNQLTSLPSLSYICSSEPSGQSSSPSLTYSNGISVPSDPQMNVGISAKSPQPGSSGLSSQYSIIILRQASSSYIELEVSHSACPEQGESGASGSKGHSSSPWSSPWSP
ncbi:MAG: Uncharacterised protein [Euryarchaeota archaeon UBA443]|nr:MAG: Uncharacterised protein [Euryarchaeota archaeon UBA443]